MKYFYFHSRDTRRTTMVYDIKFFFTGGTKIVISVPEKSVCSPSINQKCTVLQRGAVFAKQNPAGNFIN